MPALTAQLGQTEGFAYTLRVSPITAAVQGLGHSVTIDSFVAHARRPEPQRKLQTTVSLDELRTLHDRLGAYIRGHE